LRATCHRFGRMPPRQTGAKLGAGHFFVMSVARLLGFLHELPQRHLRKSHVCFPIRHAASFHVYVLCHFCRSTRHHYPLETPLTSERHVKDYPPTMRVLWMQTPA